MIVWTAGSNVPGYLPESEVEVFATRAEAAGYTISELHRAVDRFAASDLPEDVERAAEYDSAADTLGAHDADVDGDWYRAFEGGTIAYWFQSEDLPTEDVPTEVREALV